MDLEVEKIFQNLMRRLRKAIELIGSIVAAITLYFYEWFLVFSDEIELLGTLRISKGKILYYFTRIVTPFGLYLGTFHILPMRPDLDDKFCLAFVWISTILEVISIFASYWLLTLRLVALYRSKPIFVYFLYISLFTTYFTSLGLLIYDLRLFSSDTVYLPSINLCVPLNRPSFIQGVFEAPLIFEVFLFGLTAWHAWRDYLGLREGCSHVRMVPLLAVMYRDGLFYFCVMVALRVWNIIIYATRPISEMYMAIYIMWSLITILACRIYLNIVREARRNSTSTLYADQPTSSRSPHIPTFNNSCNSNAAYNDEQSSVTASRVHSRPPWGNDSLESYSMNDRWIKEDHMSDIR